MLPHNTTKLSDIKNAVRYILQYAEDHAILLPGRIPGYKRDDLQLLPSSTTKREVWHLYHSAASKGADTKAVGYSLFCALWRKLTPQVMVTRPMTDLCWVCQQVVVVVVVVVVKDVVLEDVVLVEGVGEINAVSQVHQCFSFFICLHLQNNLSNYGL